MLDHLRILEDAVMQKQSCKQWFGQACKLLDEAWRLYPGASAHTCLVSVVRSLCRLGAVLSYSLDLTSIVIRLSDGSLMRWEPQI